MVRVVKLCGIDTPSTGSITFSVGGEWEEYSDKPYDRVRARKRKRRRLLQAKKQMERAKRIARSSKAKKEAAEPVPPATAVTIGRVVSQ